MNKPRAVFIGPPVVRDFLANKLARQWEFVDAGYPIETIQDFYNALSREDITNEIQVIIVNDTLFTPPHKRSVQGGTPVERQFEMMVSEYSQYCLVIIVTYNLDKLGDEEGVIGNAIDTATGYGTLGEGKTRDNVRVWYVDPRKSPGPRLKKIAEEYVNAPTSAEETVSILRGDRRDDLPPDVKAVSQPAPTESLPDHGRTKDDPPLGHVVCVTSSKGGSGKSTITLLLSTYLAHASARGVEIGLEKRPLRVCVVDLDVNDGQIGFMINAIKPNILTMREEGISQESYEKTVLYNQELGVDFLLAPKLPRKAGDAPPHFYEELIDFLRVRYDFVVLDTSVNYFTDPVLSHVAYPMSDQIVFVVDASIQAMLSMARWIAEVTRPEKEFGMGIPAAKVGVVVNKLMQSIQMSQEDIATVSKGLSILSVIPSHSRLIMHATNLFALDRVLEDEQIRVGIDRLAQMLVGGFKGPYQLPMAKNYLMSSGGKDRPQAPAVSKWWR